MVITSNRANGFRGCGAGSKQLRPRCGRNREGRRSARALNRNLVIAHWVVQMGSAVAEPASALRAQ